MRYESPTTTREAVSLLSREKGKAFVLAGGTDLLVQLRMDMIAPDLMVDIKRIPAMSEIKKTATGFRIGAAVSGAALGRNKALVKAWWATCVMRHPLQTACRR
jgi:carbon-monoxide dehydrogenase medium subunit